MWPNLEIMLSQRYLGNYEVSGSRMCSKPVPGVLIRRKHRDTPSEDLKVEADMMVVTGVPWIAKNCH